MAGGAGKRFRADQLTGGTKDVNPQQFRMTLATAADTVFVQQGFVTPIVRLPGSAARVTIMEVLKVMFTIDQVMDTNDEGFRMAITTSEPASMGRYSQGNTLFKFDQQITFTTSGQSYHPKSWIADLSDGAGHGLLVATDTIFLGVQCISTGSIVTTDVALLYRFKSVSLPEYIGIVQSQQ